jgi:hypothetical protein
MLLNLLGAIIGGAKLIMGSDEQPHFELPAGTQESSNYFFP